MQDLITNEIYEPFIFFFWATTIDFFCLFPIIFFLVESVTHIFWILSLCQFHLLHVSSICKWPFPLSLWCLLVFLSLSAFPYGFCSLYFLKEILPYPKVIKLFFPSIFFLRCLSLWFCFSSLSFTSLEFCACCEVLFNFIFSHVDSCPRTIN